MDSSIIEVKMVKIYSVVFLKYTDSTRSTVYNKDTDTYLDVMEPFLIREDEIDFYKGFGNGFKSLNFVGYLNERILDK